MLMWEALDYGQPPEYAHLPLLVGEDKKTLKAKTFSCFRRISNNGNTP